MWHHYATKANDNVANAAEDGISHLNSNCVHWKQSAAQTETATASLTSWKEMLELATLAELVALAGDQDDDNIEVPHQQQSLCSILKCQL